MQLIQDTFIIENLQVLNEGKASDKMKIRGTFGRCNEKNNNGRIYPTAVLEAQLAKVQPLIAERRLCGELDHPQNDTVKLANASHLITKLDMKGNELIGEAEILRTPAGLTAQALVNGGVKIGISSRGMGTLSENEVGDKVVNEDFRLVTFDLVADPSTRGAYPALAESTQSQFARETQGKLQKESNFVTLLENKMKESYDPYIEEENKREEAREARAHSLVQEEARLKAFRLIKADGHWHRMAEAIAEALLGEAFGEEGDGAEADDTAGRTKAADAEARAAREQRKTQKTKDSLTGAMKRRIGAGIEARGKDKRTVSGAKAKDKATDVSHAGGEKRATTTAHGKQARADIAAKGDEGRRDRAQTGDEGRKDVAQRRGEGRKDVAQRRGQVRTSQAAGQEHGEKMKAADRGEERAVQRGGHKEKAVSRAAEADVHKSTTGDQARVRKTQSKRAAKEAINTSTEYEQFGDILSEHFDLNAKW